MNPAVTAPREEAAGDPEQRLESWKEIAAYLKRGVRTVQRWEQSEALPVHRHHHDQRGTVYAFRSEIEVWRKMRSEIASARTPFSAAETNGVVTEELSAVEADVEVLTSTTQTRAGWIAALLGLLPRGRRQRVAVGIAAVVIFLIWK